VTREGSRTRGTGKSLGGHSPAGLVQHGDDRPIVSGGHRTDGSQHVEGGCAVKPAGRFVLQKSGGV
jgi:hypothetical protein